MGSVLNSNGSMSANLFVTGTDTGVGKTRVTRLIMRLLKAEGCSVMGMKPVAAGAELLGGRLVNEDALALLEEGSKWVPYERINPVVFAQAVSPNIAASDSEAQDYETIVMENFKWLGCHADSIIVEGAGGWLTPISATMSVRELALSLELPVLMVVGLKLGCINQARLTWDAIGASGCRSVGWVANHIEEKLFRVNDVIDTISQQIGLKPLFEIPYDPGGSFSLPEASSARDIAAILRQNAP